MLGIVVLAVAALLYHLFRPLPVTPVPAVFHEYDLGEGRFVALEPPSEVFGVGLSYAKHIEETASDFDPRSGPPIFRKHPRAVVGSGSIVMLPGAGALASAVEGLEPGITEKLKAEDLQLSCLLDYEGELGFVLLEDVDPVELGRQDFVPQIGFFIANDLSARSIAILGEGMANRYDYWGLSKSFPGFMPVGGRAWIPDVPVANGIPPVIIETKVNGENRQRQVVTELVYTPRQMLRFIHETYPDQPLGKGMMVLTGTPGGVALKSPRWKVRLANAIGMSRFTKLSIKQDGDTTQFLKPGDEVTVSGGPLGSVTVTIADGD
ncbi:fumarylacetoacetate hydrolase family protein [Haloferula sp. A504]|uniref:fumarylacetoacetate hydrolase family protein n=1 Tax=Haloferula sp. A504 TaxID=3373601 RepID=UPI0031BE0E9D|nr:fumarylacetoacetate hydrolase family protein [Verrucomicrobiaceae bacterium E54]